MVKYFLYHENHQEKLERPQEDFFIKPLQDKNFLSQVENLGKMSLRGHVTSSALRGRGNPRSAARPRI